MEQEKKDLSSQDKTEQDGGLTLKDRYEILIKARNFHYENFNKWMTYFYVMIAALVVGLCNILAKSNDNSHILTDKSYILTIISSLGFIISIAWYWANKGYYYWNINFITLVNHYESNLLKLKEKERIYFVFANKEKQNDYTSPVSGANISTSKISILLAFIITCFWGFLLMLVILKEAFNYFWLYYLVCLLFPACLIHILSKYFAQKYLLSNHIHFPDLKLDFPEWNKIS